MIYINRSENWKYKKNKVKKYGKIKSEQYKTNFNSNEQNNNEKSS